MGHQVLIGIVPAKPVQNFLIFLIQYLAFYIIHIWQNFLIKNTHTQIALKENNMKSLKSVYLF